jgi:hypothetical protein
MYLYHSINKIFYYLSNKSDEKLFAFKLALVLTISTSLFSYPKIFEFFQAQRLPYVWDTITLKSTDLTNNLDHLDPYSWQAKKVFRLTIPVIVKLFNLSPKAIGIIQIVVGYFFFVVSFKLAENVTKDKLQATFITLGLSFLYTGKAAFFEYEFAWFDGFSYFFLLMAMFSRNLSGIFVYTTLAAWNDERALLSCTLVYLFHHLNYLKNTEKIEQNFLVINLGFNKKGLAVLVALSLYILLRIYSTTFFQMHTPLGNVGGVGFHTLFNRTFYLIPIGLLTFLEGFWFLLFLFFLMLLRKKEYLLLVLITIPLLLLVTGSFFVADVTRSGAFIFPMVFIVLLYLKAELSKVELRKLIFICVFVSFLIPPIFICSDWSLKKMFTKPLIVHLVDKNRDAIKSFFDFTDK